jgi:hypothetical protein
MARYDRVESGKFITDFDALDRLEDMLTDSLQRALNDFDVGAELDEMHVFGSWARGTAIPEQSDLDVIAFVITNQEARFDANKIPISARFGDLMEMGRFSSSRFRWFDGIDTFVEHARNKQTMLQSKATETRDDRPEGQTGTYNLTERNYKEK